MTKDLIARAKEYLENTKGITEGEWYFSHHARGDGIYSGVESVVTVDGVNEVSNVDEQAINLTPTARRLIEELAKEVETLKNHGIDLLDQYCSMAKHLENLALISNLQDAREYAKVKLEVFQTKDNQNDRME